MQLFGHKGHNIGLTDRLPFADRHGVVGIRFGPVILWNKAVPGNRLHRPDNQGIFYAAGYNLLFYHALT